MRGAKKQRGGAEWTLADWRPVLASAPAMVRYAIGLLPLLLSSLIVACGGDDGSADADPDAGGPAVVQGEGPWSPTPPANNPCPMFPADNWWNTDISNAPVDAKSDKYIAGLGAGKAIGAGFGVDGHGFPVGYVDNRVPKVEVTFDFPFSSDPGPYPIPKDPPIQPHAHDRHLLLFHTDECNLYEMFFVWPTVDGWTASSGVVWDLTKNQKRPPGQGSADGAGLAILPGLIDYDQVETGSYNHAVRVATFNVQNAYAHPATYPGLGINDPDLPPMGARLRLKANVDISGFSPRIRAMYTALKKYGVIIADRAPDGDLFLLDGIPDERWDPFELNGMRSLHVSDLEVIETGPITKNY